MYRDIDYSKIRTKSWKATRYILSVNTDFRAFLVANEISRGYVRDAAYAAGYTRSQLISKVDSIELIRDRLGLETMSV